MFNCTIFQHTVHYVHAAYKYSKVLYIYDISVSGQTSVAGQVSTYADVPDPWEEEGNLLNVEKYKTQCVITSTGVTKTSK